jgi:hypothetical protein
MTLFSSAVKCHVDSIESLTASFETLRATDGIDKAEADTGVAVLTQSTLNGEREERERSGASVAM